MIRFKEAQVKVMYYWVLIITYVFPSGIVELFSSAITKLLFISVIFGMHIVNTIIAKKIKYWHLFLFAICLVQLIITRESGVLGLLVLPFLDSILDSKNKIYDLIQKSTFPYVCLLFTVFYSLLYSQTNLMESDRGGLAFTAIGEANQSGLAIFCLGCILRKKNKKIGIAVYLFGILTNSRSYLLALLCLIVHKVLCRIKRKNRIDLIYNYNAILWTSNCLLLGAGFLYVWFYQRGLILPYVTGEGFSRIFHLLDYSNFFRFEAIYIVFSLILNNPIYFVLGMSDSTYILQAYELCNRLNIPFKGTPPHNLFFSHLKKYGFLAIIEAWYTAKILRKVVNRYNYGVFFAILLYSIFLGAGLYSYWLYISVLSMLSFTPRDGISSIPLSHDL